MKISAKILFSMLGIRYEPHQFQLKVEEASKILTMLGFEVEDIHYEAVAFKNIVIGQIVECNPHPESSKLSVCAVSNGAETFQVLCGAPNVHKGLKVVLAQKGAVIPKNGMVIQKAKLAGMESNGMICSADELCIGKNDGTILELYESAPLGSSYAEFAKKNDAILDIAITPNRGDALSYRGISRELVSQNFGTLPTLELVQTQFKELDVVNVCQDLTPSVFFCKISKPEKIPNYSEDLKKSGVSSSGIPIVDVLNFATELYGQPMHLYDASKIQGQIAVRQAKEGELLITLSGEEILLQGGEIVVADEEKILCLAGIVGDARSAVSLETKEFILESCAFQRDSIFTTSRKHKLHTGASFRFERYVNAGSAAFFPQKLLAFKFLEMIEVQPLAVFEMQSKVNPSVEVISVGHLNNILGIELTLNEVVEILNKLGFTCIGDEGNLKITIPSFRANDIKTVHDFAEEIIRSIGIERCGTKILSAKPQAQQFRLLQVKQFLARTLHEVITFPFISEKDHRLFSAIAEDKTLRLANPMNEEIPIMRSSIISSVLRNIAKANSLSENSSRIFEIAKVFQKGEENLEICIARSGFAENNNPISSKREYTIFDVKEDVLSLLENFYGLKRDSVVYNTFEHNAFHPHQAFTLTIGRNVIATLAQIHPLVLEELGINNKTFVATVHLSNIPVKQVKSSVKGGYVQSLLPNVKREVSAIFNEEVTCLEILRSLQKITKNRFTGNVVEIYCNDELKLQNKKSILIQFEIFQMQKTLVLEEIDAIMAEICQVLEEVCGAVIRGNE